MFEPTDQSPLLLCAPEGVGSDVAADDEIIAALLEGGPRCIPPEQLQIYKAQPFPKSSDSGESRTLTATTLYRAMWRIVKGKKLEAAIKLLQEEERKFTKEFLELASKWGQLRSGALVRLYGLTLSPAVGMLMELVKLGPLDVYLRNNSPETVQTVDMVEAAACLATALWHLVSHLKKKNNNNLSSFVNPWLLAIFCQLFANFAKSLQKKEKKEKNWQKLWPKYKIRANKLSGLFFLIFIFFSILGGKRGRPW